MIRILIADDQALVRGALVALLRLESDLEVVAEVGTGADAVTAARTTAPDVALLDVQMPGMDGFTAAAELQTVCPDCRVIVCTTFGRPGYLTR
ncbi:MAG: response regulator, partial [Mycobacteriaceae bacterium]